MIKVGVSLIFLALLIACGYSKHLSDIELEQRFVSNKVDFLKLAKMLDDDKNIVRLSHENIFYSGSSQNKISEERLREYRNLLRKLKLDIGIHRDNPSSIRFIASTKGFPISSSEKSFLFSTNDVSPLVGSLDQIIAIDYGDRSPIYKKIDDNWYLVYESW